MPDLRREMLHWRDETVAQSLAPAAEPRPAWGEGKAAVAALEAAEACYPSAVRSTVLEWPLPPPHYSFGLTLAAFAKGFTSARRVELQRAEDGIAHPDPIAPDALEGEALRAWGQGVREGTEQGARENRKTMTL